MWRPGRKLFEDEDQFVGEQDTGRFRFPGAYRVPYDLLFPRPDVPERPPVGETEPLPHEPPTTTEEFEENQRELRRRHAEAAEIRSELDEGRQEPTPVLDVEARRDELRRRTQEGRAEQRRRVEELGQEMPSEDSDMVPIADPEARREQLRIAQQEGERRRLEALEELEQEDGDVLHRRPLMTAEEWEASQAELQENFREAARIRNEAAGITEPGEIESPEVRRETWARQWQEGLAENEIRLAELGQERAPERPEREPIADSETRRETLRQQLAAADVERQKRIEEVGGETVMDPDWEASYVLPHEWRAVEGEQKVHEYNEAWRQQMQGLGPTGRMMEDLGLDAGMADMLTPEDLANLAEQGIDVENWLRKQAGDWTLPEGIMDHDPPREPGPQGLADWGLGGPVEDNLYDPSYGDIGDINWGKIRDVGGGRQLGGLPPKGTPAREVHDRQEEERDRFRREAFPGPVVRPARGEESAEFAFDPFVSEWEFMDTSSYGAATGAATTYQLADDARPMPATGPAAISDWMQFSLPGWGGLQRGLGRVLGGAGAGGGTSGTGGGGGGDGGWGAGANPYMLAGGFLGGAHAIATHGPPLVASAPWVAEQLGQSGRAAWRDARTAAEGISDIGVSFLDWTAGEGTGTDVMQSVVQAGANLWESFTTHPDDFTYQYGSPVVPLDMSFDAATMRGDTGRDTQTVPMWGRGHPKSGLGDLEVGWVHEYDPEIGNLGLLSETPSVYDGPEWMQEAAMIADTAATSVMYPFIGGISNVAFPNISVPGSIGASLGLGLEGHSKINLGSMYSEVTRALMEGDVTQMTQEEADALVAQSRAQEISATPHSCCCGSNSTARWSRMDQY